MINYKRTIVSLLLIFLLVNCVNTSKNHPVVSTNEDTLVSKDSVSLIFHKVSNLYVIGDFEGKGTKDTIFQSIFSNKTKIEIQRAPDPFSNDWEKVEKWFYDQDATVLLAFKSPKNTILNLGIAQGLYCLLNVGDNNNDGKEEIALVIDKLDESRVNTCQIYSYCSGKWVVLKQFDILEDAFDYSTDGTTPPTFTSIKEYLEKKAGKWVYKDYSQNEYDNPNDVGKLLPLQISKCD